MLLAIVIVVLVVVVLIRGISGSGDGSCVIISSGVGCNLQLTVTFFNVFCFQDALL